MSASPEALRVIADSYEFFQNPLHHTRFKVDGPFGSHCAVGAIRAFAPTMTVALEAQGLANRQVNGSIMDVNDREGRKAVQRAFEAILDANGYFKDPYETTDRLMSELTDRIMAHLAQIKAEATRKANLAEYNAVLAMPELIPARPEPRRWQYPVMYSMPYETAGV